MLKKSTGCGIVKQVSKVIVRILLPKYIYVPQNRREVQDKIDGFKSATVDGCHLPIIGRQQSPDDYINRKGFHSLIHKGLVDCNYRFLDICVGCPGKVHDAQNSPLFALCCARTFLPLDMSVIGVPPVILGDSAYALSDWLIKPYRDRGNLTPEEGIFNVKHSTTRVVVENALGPLKGRFNSNSPGK